MEFLNENHGGIMMTGQKVTCINDSFTDWIKVLYDELPVKGVTYTIRSIGVGVNHYGEPGEICVYLNELKNPLMGRSPHPEFGFNADRFRPIDEVSEEMKASNLNVIHY